MRFAEWVYARFSTGRTRADAAWLNRLTEREPLRTICRSVSGFGGHDVMLWASALTYTSVLSLVPILAIGLSALKGLGGVERMKPLIEHFLAIDSPQIADQILGFVANISATALGEVGGAVLLFTVVLTLGTIERAFNHIFNVSRGRTWLRKFSDYLSVTFTLPVLMAAAVGVKTQFMHQMPHLPGIAWLAGTIPLWAGFSFLYMFFPNTRVRWHCAMLGGLVAAIMLQLGQWSYIRFQVGAARYHAIYGALAAVPMLLTWIYMAWIIVLYGAELTAAAQGIGTSLQLDSRSPGFPRIAALLTVLRAGERMIKPGPSHPCTVHALALELGVSDCALAPVFDQLKLTGIIVESAEVSPVDRTHPVLLGRDSSEISVAEVLAAIDRAPATVRGQIAAVLEGISAAERDRLGALTVKDLVSGHFKRLAEPVAHEP
jgi:membrane protein